VAENERLRAENALLRERLANVQAIALERERRIEDLKHALRMLPSVWARKLEARLGSASEEAVQAQATAEPPSVDQEPPRDRAEVILEEVTALRARLERRRLEVEREMLEEERRKIQADLAWTRQWRRFRASRAAPS
jgi:hypothetical protein